MVQPSGRRDAGRRGRRRRRLVGRGVAARRRRRRRHSGDHGKVAAATGDGDLRHGRHGRYGHSVAGERPEDGRQHG